MIGSLRGRLLELFGDGEVLIEVGGVGYRVIVTPTTAVRLGDVGGDVFVHVHHHIREADQTLYGFLERDERTCFEALLSAHGSWTVSGPRRPRGARSNSMSLSLIHI